MTVARLLRTRLERSLARLPLTDRVTYARELVSATFYGLYAGIAIPLVPIVARRIGMTPEAITAMVTMQFVSALFGMLLGHLAENRPKMPFVTWPNVAGRGAVSFLALANDPVSFLVVASVFYFSLNLSGPAYASIMRTNYSTQNRGRLMGNIRILVTVVSAVVSTAAGIVLVSSEHLVRWLFLAAGIFGVLSSLLFALIKVRRDPASDALPATAPSRAPGAAPAVAPAVPLSVRPRGRTMRLLAANRSLLLFLSVYFVCASPDKLAIPLEPIWMVDTLHLDYGEASLLLGTVTSLAGVAGYFFWARALKRRSSFTLMVWVVAFFAARFASLALARTGIQLLPMSVFSGICNAGWDLVPLFCMIELTDPAAFSLAFGVHTTLFGIRGVIGPALGTYLYATGLVSLPAIFWLIAAVLGAGAVMMAVFSRGRRAGSASRA
ncbi:MAG TPA: MFS transporter [Spirochaetia bacterium]|nr:MFS transporter [Spirochaetia bacterium]